MRGHFVVGAILALVALNAGAQNNPVPLLNQPLIPTAVAPGSKAFTLTVNGTGFASGAVVNWNGSPRLTEVISSKQLKATIDASDVSTAKTGWVTVTNPTPGGGTSNVVFLPVTNPTSTIGMAISQPFPGATFAAAGDFNNDGKLDVGWESSAGFNVSLGNGNGGFSAPITNPNIGGDSFAIGDFNGDGKLDVAVAEQDRVYLWLGNGDGTFTEAWEYAGVFNGGYVTADDFSLSGQISFYHTSWDLGSQWFEFIFDGNAGATYYTSYFPGPAAVGDFNGDGWPDLAIFEINGLTHIWLGSASGFSELGTISVDNIPMVVADMNQDGNLDLNYGCIYLGAGNGTFTPAGCPPNADGYGSASLAGVGDFNGDGKLDSADYTFPSGVMFSLGAGDGTYSASFPFAVPGIPLPDQVIAAVGDFNNDGRLDLVTSNGYLLIQTTVDLSPYSLAFGNQNVGTKSAAQNATLTNVGTSALTINTISITGTNSGQFMQTNDCGTSLAAGASCAISVIFAPLKGGSLTAALTVSYKGTASPEKVQLSGTGITPPTATLKPASLKYATQLVGTTSPSQTATYTNTGDQTVTISNIAISGAFTQMNNCSSSLSVAQSCVFTVAFTPSAAGTASGSLTVTDNTTTSPHKVVLTGIGTVITLSPISINFGDQKVGTTSGTAPVTLTNNGTSTVSISAISITGTNASDFAETNNCGKSLAAHGSCTINVAFKPTATGSRLGAVSITDNGGGSPQSVGLTGTGT